MEYHKVKELFLPNLGNVKRKEKLDAFKEVINTCLKQGVTNAAVILSELKKEGFTGGLTIVKNYISSNKDIVPAKRILVAPQSSRGRRYTTRPGEAFQMDWGFTIWQRIPSSMLYYCMKCG